VLNSDHSFAICICVNRRDRSTDLAIRMVVEVIMEARRSGGIASLLQLDIKGAFDAVHHQWLIQILRTTGYPTWYYNWVRNHLANKLAFFFFDNYKLFRFDISADMPQKSLLSHILFLNYKTFRKIGQFSEKNLAIIAKGLSATKLCNIYNKAELAIVLR
jgi:hypothetical protein